MADADALSTDFARRHPDAFARTLSRGTMNEIAEVLKSLPPAISASIAARLPSSRISGLLASGDSAEVTWLVEASFDDAKALLSRIPREYSLALVNSISDKGRRRKLLQYLNYPAHSVGALVAEVALRFTSNTPAIEVLKEMQSIETGFPGLVAIVQPDGRFLGALDIWALLVTHAPNGHIKDFTVATPSLHPETSMMSAAADRDWHNHSCLPVIDQEKHLLGCVTRERLFTTIEQRNEQTSPASDIFLTLFSDLIRLFGQTLDWVFGRGRIS